MRTGKFYLDFLGEQTFDGYTQGEDWNGFACPYYNYEQAMKLVDAWRTKGWHAEYDSAADSFVFEMADGKNESGEINFAAMELEEMKLYPIGTFFWIWDEADNL